MSQLSVVKTVDSSSDPLLDHDEILIFDAGMVMSAALFIIGIVSCIQGRGEFAYSVFGVGTGVFISTIGTIFLRRRYLTHK